MSTHQRPGDDTTRDETPGDGVPGDESSGNGAPADHEDEQLPTATQSSAGRMGPSAGIPVEKSRDFREAMRQLWRLLAVERTKLIVAFSLTFGSVALVVIGPRILGEATDVIVEGVVTGDGIDFDRLHRILLAVGAVYAVSWVLAYGQAYILAGVVQRTMYRLRESVEAKLHRLPLSYIDTHARGDLLSRVTNDIDNFAQSLQQTTSQIITNALTLIGVTVMMFTISPLLALVALVTVPLSLVCIKQLAGRARPKFMEQWGHTGSLNAQAEEVFTGHTVVRAFGRRAQVEERFSATNDELYEASFRAQFIASLIQPVMMFLGSIQYALVAVVGGMQVANGSISIGDVQAFIQYARQFSQPMTHLASMANVFQSGIASLERVLELLDAPEHEPDPEPVGLTKVRGEVVFDDVSFRYEPAKPLIEHLDLEVRPGQTVAIVGPTGAGKTTLVNLLMRFYEIDAGTISLDGHDLTTLPRAELRSKVGMVLQDTWLFGGTIRDNIAYGRPSATEDEILAAAEATYVDRFVHSLPDGYDTVIGDEGSSLSAGERQLLTIARAFLADPAMLILDEATSSVDTRTEVLIQEAMNALRVNRTSFVIAHRLSTIRGADIILVMENGSIVEQGSHAELLELGGAYRRLHDAQFAGTAT